CDSTSSLDSVIIQNGTLPAVPVINQIGDTLFSSYATGNQWFYNSAIIPGATGPYYLPQQSGLYLSPALMNRISYAPISHNIPLQLPLLEI
ncbi:MAG: hypothetical protein ABI700_27405, partial [Chloroflexota bacterium]